MWKYTMHGFARQMSDDLTVRQCAVDAGAHRTEVTLADGGIDRRTGEFAIGQPDAVVTGAGCHFFQKLGTDLVAESA